MPNLTIICGLPGTGKSTQAKKIAAKTNAILLRTDTIRKELGRSKYSVRDRQAVYREMFLRAGKLLGQAKNIVLDATFSKRENREAAKKLAKDCGATFQLLEIICPEKIIKERMKRRAGGESEARFREYLKYKKVFEPIEEKHIIINTGSK